MKYATISKIMKLDITVIA